MYKALYRKYRPKTFDDLVGQEHITVVLKNQIKSNSISHAYLFSGTRGTGKTSCAKILARAVNCESEEGDKPCNKCSSCIESLEESAIDIIEIDGASNSGVDNIRDLKDRAYYQPTSLKYKVYIIDEIHMLSKGAFNALLKILEEPPDHLIFILATTEPERIPLTILSRCQKFQFKRIDSKTIEKSLREIATAEGVSIDDRTYSLIINSSDGSMRDAQSIMEQLVSSGMEEIDYKYATNVLGVVSSDILFHLVDKIIENDAGELLEILDETISSGKDIEQLGKDILDHFRRLMIAKVSKDSLSRLVHTNEEEYLSQSSKFSLDYILLAMEKLIEQLSEIKYSHQKRTLLEIVMMEIINFNHKKNNKEINANSNEQSKNYNITVSKDEIKEKTLVPEVTETASKEISDNMQGSTKHSPEIKESINEIVGPELTLDKIKNDWNDILVEVKNSSRKLIHAFIIESSISDYDGDTLTLAFNKDYQFHKDNLMKQDNREFLENILTMFYNRNVRINAVFLDEQGSTSIDKDIETLTKLVGEKNIKIL